MFSNCTTSRREGLSFSKQYIMDVFVLTDIQPISQCQISLYKSLNEAFRVLKTDGTLFLNDAETEGLDGFPTDVRLGLLSLGGIFICLQV